MSWEARFWRKVQKGRAEECWPWLGGKSKFGHGRFKIGGQLYLPHRLAYLIANDNIPDDGEGSYHGTVIRHSCDNPSCCNPAHLLAGTQRDNVQDMFERGRAGKSVPNLCQFTLKLL